MLGLAEMPIETKRGLVICNDCEMPAVRTLMVVGQADLRLDAQGNIESAVPKPLSAGAPPPIDLCLSCLAILKSELIGDRPEYQIDADDLGVNVGLN